MNDDDAPGWDAITQAAGSRGCSAYDAGAHWHFVTYGLTELWAKGPDSEPDWSGWGYELTMRVAKHEDEPPPWPFNLLEQIARHTHTSGNMFAEGHRLDPGGPITGEPSTSLMALAFTADPGLGAIDTPNGRVEFLQVVGITAGELAEMKATSTADVLRRFASVDPFLVTDAARS